MLSRFTRSSVISAQRTSRLLAQRQFVAPTTVMNRQFTSLTSTPAFKQQKQNFNGTNFMKYMMPLMGFGFFMYQYTQKMNECAKATVSQNNKGNEDNKIRFFGSPQQIFSNFATCDGDDGNLEMSYDEFLKALVPYNYMSPKDYVPYFAKYQSKINSILHVADVDKNGQISFCEFYFFVLIMTTSDRNIKAAFKKHGGKMNMKQFSTNLTVQRKKSNFGKKLEMLKSTDEEFIQTNQVMSKNIFNGRNEITEAEYIDFRNSIQELLWHYEFHQYDLNAKDEMNLHDFAISMIIYFPFQSFQQYLKHLNAEQHHCLHHDMITFNEYVGFQYLLQERQLIIDEVMSTGQIDQEGLRLIADEFTAKNEFMQRTGTTISDRHLLSFLTTLDLDGNLVLDTDEVIGILNKKKQIGASTLCTKKHKHSH